MIVILFLLKIFNLIVCFFFPKNVRVNFSIFIKLFKYTALPPDIIKTYCERIGTNNDPMMNHFPVFRSRPAFGGSRCVVYLDLAKE